MAVSRGEKKYDMFGLTYINPETKQVGINPDIGLLELIEKTHRDEFEAIKDKDSFLADISKVNILLQQIYLRDVELRWQKSENINEIDAIVNQMPHQRPSPEKISQEIDLMIFPGTTGILMTAIAATARKAILEGAKIKRIAVLGCEQEWQQPWVKELETLFSLVPDLIRKDVDLTSIDFDKKYNEHEINKLISSVIDFGDSDIHFEFLPVAMKVSPEGKLIKTNTDDEARVLYQYHQRVSEEIGHSPSTVLVSTKGFHVRQSYSFIAAGMRDIQVLMSDPQILGEACAEKFSHLVCPNTRAKLDNLAKTIYQTLQVLKVLYPELALPLVSDKACAFLPGTGTDRTAEQSSTTLSASRI